MNVRRTLVSVTTLFLSFNVLADDVGYRFIAGDDSRYTHMCVKAGNNDLDGLKKMLYHDFDPRSDTVNTLYCNGQLISHFSAHYGAADTAKYLNKFSSWKNRLPKDVRQKIDLAKHQDDATQLITLVVTSRQR
ncbi:hypothetical protein [Thalassotalea maritima]|uniref:hypothetical protein n=1 Tax=Thalassotalea maritima TaxID=3242416 RepID=UPI0035275782